MLTRRTVLGSAGALGLWSRARAKAGDDAERAVALQPASLRLAEGAPTEGLRFDGVAPDGTVRLALGGPTALEVRNQGAASFTPAVEGLRGVGSLDRPQPPVMPGSVGRLAIEPRDGGTALLRAAAAPDQACARGAHAVLVVPEAQAPPVDHDQVVTLADWMLARDNSLRFGSVPPADATAAVVTVNGDPRPCQMVAPPRARIRLRFVNASVQRLMVVACSGARPMIAAIDGQPSSLFAPMRNAVPIGPGARYDLLLDLPDVPGSTVRFSLKSTMLVAGRPEAERDLVILRTEGAPLPPKPPITPLPANPKLPVEIPLEAASRAELTVSGRAGTPTAPAAGWAVNGIPGPAADRPVLTVRRGRPVVLGFSNPGPTLVPLRIGGHAVRLLHAKDDGWEPYWRDTLLLAPGGRSHVAFVADVVGRWPITSGFDDLTLAGLSCAVDVVPD